jgi:hypothetical protein
MPPIRSADAASAILTFAICHLLRIRPSNPSRPCFGVNRLTGRGAECSILPSAGDAARFFAARDSTEVTCSAPLIAPTRPVKYRGNYSRPADALSGNDFDQSTIPSNDTQNHNLGGAADFAAVSLTARNSNASIVRTGMGLPFMGMPAPKIDIAQQRALAAARRERPDRVMNTRSIDLGNDR